ncbi:hypothetical protein ALQ18_01385 [Pseudomonas marginalis pv. marginalis]|nr:hypothetical protein ALQ18_01385 [Pseudomonas marginalis pv. marginalis]
MGMDDEESKREALDMLAKLKRESEHMDATHVRAAEAVAAIKADMDRSLKDHLENMRKMKQEQEMALEAGSRVSNFFDLISYVKPVLIAVFALSSSLTILIASKPDFMVVLLTNPLATSLGAISLIALGCVLLVNLVQARGSRDSFVEIDERLFDKSTLHDQIEKNNQRFRLRSLEEKLSQLTTKGVEEVPSEFIPPANEPDKISHALPEYSGFERYMLDLTRYLETHISVSEKKASLLLDKGTSYLWRGIVFYILSIVVWQVVTAFFKLGEYVVWGMVSCSLTFLVVEFLAAWFLRQYKSFTDAAFNLVRVKSVFNRYFLSYLAIKEFSSSIEDVAGMRAQMLKVIEEDIKWLEPAPQKLGELNHMVAMFESMSGFVEKLKTSSKSPESKTAP